MLRLLKILGVILAILISIPMGIYAGIYLNDNIQLKYESPSSNIKLDDIASPYNHIQEKSILVDGKNVVISFNDREVTWSRFTDTNSMDPVFDSGHNALEITPKTESDVHLGDIIAFKYNINGVEKVVVHRVIEIGFDELGWYAKTKGDNSKADPGKRRFNEIVGIVVGILY